VHRVPLVETIKIEQFDRVQNYGRCQKLGIGFLFERYDRIIQLDDTCMISPHTPDLLELVPENAIGCYIAGPDRGEHFESYLQAHRRAYNRSAKLSRSQFYNNGVAVYSRRHAELFNSGAIPWPVLRADRTYPTGGYLSHRAESLGYQLHDLGIAFNLMGSRLKKMAHPQEASAFIFHLTSALTPKERFEWAQRLDGFFRGLSPSARGPGNNTWAT
jgi:hypothetical protein